MEIKEFNRHKKEMESELLLEFSRIISKFKDRTGYTPNTIYVNMREMRQYGIEGTFYIVESVETEVKI